MHQREKETERCRILVEFDFFPNGEITAKVKVTSLGTWTCGFDVQFLCVDHNGKVQHRSRLITIYSNGNVVGHGQRDGTLNLPVPQHVIRSTNYVDVNICSPTRRYAA